MTTQTHPSTSTTTWFVGASFGHTDDQTARFLKDGIWEILTPTEKERALVRAMQPGERIAIKAAYVRKNGLPFDSRGHSVSVMGIKAVGTIVHNPQDGERVQVKWQPAEGVREWYFYTYRSTIWRVLPGDWMNDALIAFAFDQQPQDIERFRNEPYWRERFGSIAPDKLRFPWPPFYEAVAEKLLDFANDRTRLIEGIKEIAAREPKLRYLRDTWADDSVGPEQDICPFTVMGTFNRSLTGPVRRAIAGELAQLLGVTVPVPSRFDGTPTISNTRTSLSFARSPGDVDAVWRLFVAAHALVEDDRPETREAFIEAYDATKDVWNAKGDVSEGLYLAHPWDFLPLDTNSRNYVNKVLGFNIPPYSTDGPVDAASYLKLLDDLRVRFCEGDYPVHSFPELFIAARRPSGLADETVLRAENSEGAGERGGDEAPPDTVQAASPIVPYSVDDILNDGCFLERADLDLLIDRLRAKKNLILQGPPGTGKTWLAKRLAFALMGEKDPNRIRAVQFHPNLSYEDFVRGWRPTGDGKLALADGVFMEAIIAARKAPSAKFVVVIEEINRGNPAQIFGELLTLLEAGKRTPSEALELCYLDADGKRRPVHIPENLYVIGTMNIADRSLALVDLALRRRFAFVGLEPRLGTAWRNWVVEACGVDATLVADIEHRITELNDTIAADARLGKQFQIGHSYVTPAHRLEPGDTRKWFRQVVATEIGPLLDEYWFDAPAEAEQATARLIQGW